ncbi:hypothetical protein GCM10017687_53090 [Streptomyces echinatus]
MVQGDLVVCAVPVYGIAIGVGVVARALRGGAEKRGGGGGGRGREEGGVEGSNGTFRCRV